MKAITRLSHEVMLNLQSPPLCSLLWIICGKDRSLKYEGRWGTALKKYDPYQFELSLNKARRDKIVTKVITLGNRKKFLLTESQQECIEALCEKLGCSIYSKVSKSDIMQRMSTVQASKVIDELLKGNKVIVYL